MFNIGLLEIFVIVVVALLVIGPKDLPVVARRTGRAVRHVKTIIADIKKAIDDELNRDNEPKGK